MTLLWYVSNVIYFAVFPSFKPLIIYSLHLQITIRFISQLLWFSLLASCSKGWGILFSRLSNRDFVVLSFIVTSYTAIDTYYQFNNTIYNTTANTVNVQISMWILTVVFFNHLIRSGVVSMIYASTYIDDLTRDRIEHGWKRMYKDCKTCSIDGLVSVYQGKHRLERYTRNYSCLLINNI